MDDEFEAFKPAHPPGELERWNIEDLNAYKTRLLEEISLIDAVLDSKGDVRSAAENLFKS
jgi:uncharacterized small protein (DUF1192 family)